jgi:hypothetical protein
VPRRRRSQPVSPLCSLHPYRVPSHQANRAISRQCSQLLCRLSNPPFSRRCSLLCSLQVILASSPQRDPPSSQAPFLPRNQPQFPVCNLLASRQVSPPRRRLFPRINLRGSPLHSPLGSRRANRVASLAGSLPDSRPGSPLGSHPPLLPRCRQPLFPQRQHR